MKNSKPKKIFVFILALALAVTFMPAVSASEPPAGAQITDIYSPWAEFYVLMADAYGLGNEGTYSNFRGGLTEGKFSAVLESLDKNFVYEFEDINNTVTRGEVIAGLYGIITGEPDAGEEALEYFINERLISGRASGNYQLDEICTVEEMIIFSVRAYEHINRLAENYSSGFFWQVNGGKSTVYLLGSIHFGDISIYPMSKAIEDAFASSPNFGVEVNVAAISEEDLAYISQQQLILDGTVISDYISPETYELYAEVMQMLELPAEVYDYIQPWAASTMLTNIIAELSGSEESPVLAVLGMDMHYLIKAALARKNIFELENVRLQIDMLASFSPELQEMQLLENLTGFMSLAYGQTEEDAEAQAAAAGEVFLTMLEAVRDGDDEVMGMMLGVGVDIEELDPLAFELLDKLLRQRDKGMAASIAALLEDGSSGDYFIIIGAAHFIGEGGNIIELLEEMGYDATRIK